MGVWGGCERREMDENNAHLLENASYAMQGLKQKVPDELDRLGISFASLALREEELASAEHSTQRTCVACVVSCRVVCANL